MRANWRRHSKTEKFRRTQAKYKASGQYRAWRRADQKKRLNDPLARFKMFIRSATQAAVRAGLIVKMGCEVCRVADVQAHHTDYGKPLEVRWLCAVHHSDLHKEEKST